MARLRGPVLIFAALFLLSASGPISAQTTVFGKNKVQYKDFDWYFIQSSHFDEIGRAHV
jgi:hypothetical protein